ncbi:MAG: hypothetical protein JOZ16_15930 [Methylobacteriaceae bacterium]|nr:hypothetical protein [Methylobacteriaceae bacterium]
MKIAAAHLFAAAALVAALPAAAQSQYRTRHAEPYQEGRTVYAPSQNACVPLCARDTSPCDPPYFKAADGRCDYPMIGR